MGTAAKPSASGSAPPSWEALPDSTRRIYLALAEGDEEQARQLLTGDRQTAATRRARPRPRGRRAQPRTSSARTLDLRGFVERREGRFEPAEMRAAEAWKRRMAGS
jgi:hypothetical protein